MFDWGAVAGSKDEDVELVFFAVNHQALACCFFNARRLCLDESDVREVVSL